MGLGYVKHCMRLCISVSSWEQMEKPLRMAVLFTEVVDISIM